MIIEKLKEKFSKGISSSKDAGELEINARMFSHLVKKGDIQSITQGFYSFAGTDPIGDDWKYYDLATTASSYKDAVIV